MTSRRRLVFLCAAGVALSEACWGQRALDWRFYKLADGLPESACISVTVSLQGKVVVRHFSLPSVTQLNGYSVEVNGAPEMGRSRVYESPAGQLWTVAPDQGLLEFKEGSWILRPVPEIAAETRSGSGRLIDPVPLCPVRQGVVLFLLHDSLREFSADSQNPGGSRLLRSAEATGLGSFSGMSASRDGGLWLSGARGLAKLPGPLRGLKPETPWQEYLLPQGLQVQHLQTPFETISGGITNLTMMAESATNHQRVLLLFDGQQWTLEPVSVDKPRQAWRTPDNMCWTMTIDSLLEWEPGRPEVVENEEISARQYFDFALEPSGAFWLATSDGLCRHAPLLWRTPKPLRTYSSPVRCLTGDSTGRLWFIVGTRLFALQGGRLQEIALRGAAARIVQLARAVFGLRDGTLVFDNGERLFRFSPSTGTFAEIAVETGGQRRVLGLLADGTLCIQRLEAGSAAGGCILERFDGTQFEPLSQPGPPPKLGGTLAALFVAQNGDLWLGGEAGAAYYHDQTWHTFASEDETSPVGVLGFTDSGEGRIWCATADRVWEFDGRKWSLIRSGFDRINALLRSRRDGSIWVASNNGLHRFSQGAWVENNPDDGMPSAAVRELFEDGSGNLWAATTRGLSRFFPEADTDPPQAVVPGLTEVGGSIQEGSAVTVTFSGQDKWKYTARERLLFSFRLDDRDWSPFQEAGRFPTMRTVGTLPMYGVTFTELSAGKHSFQVRAMDRNCNISRPMQREFAIILPWYKETRLVLITATGATAALFFAGLAFNRHRRLVRSYAEVEKKVAERTLQLEAANRELVQSQKMKALGTLAAGIAHDFNNILSIIRGSAQIIEDNLDNPDKIRTRADRIRTVVEQGAGIVKAMLGFSRDTGQQPALCDLNTVVEDTLKLLGDRFLREVQVRFQPTPALPPIMALKDFLQQILLNFIFNAAESMSNHRLILVTTRSVETLPPSLILVPATARGYVAVSVQDYGCGIPPENLPRIFEPFFTTKALSSRRGTGLGLSMVYELAKNLGAGLQVESRVDQGSTFTLLLPVRETA